MITNDLITLLKSYSGENDPDCSVAEKILNFINITPKPFHRETSVGHITGSAWVVNTTYTKALLTHHKKLGKWLQLGGHADGDDNILRVAQRELTEESGLCDVALLSDEIFDLDVHVIPSRKKEPEHLHYDIRFLFCADDSKPLVVQRSESHHLQWVDLNEIKDLLTDESVLRMVRKSTKSIRC